MGSLEKAFLTGFICRICSKMNKVVIHVYGEEGKRINLANQLQVYLGVDVNLNDNLPKTVCPSCIVKLKMYYEWMELIMKTQKEFENTINDFKMYHQIGDSPVAHQIGDSPVAHQIGDSPVAHQMRF